MNKKKIVVLFISMVLFSCVKKRPDTLTYQDTMEILKSGLYNIAAEKFEAIEDENPFTQEAVNGLVMSAYSYYKSKLYDDSLRVIDYFIYSNPVSPSLPYIYYLRGLVYYSQITSVERSRDVIEIAKYSFQESLLKYPNSIYVADIKKKIVELNDMLSNNDLIIGEFYLNNKNYIGAINHFTRIIADLDNTKYELQAIYRLVEINDILGIKDDATKYYTLLESKYKDNNLTKKAKEIIDNYTNTEKAINYTK
jgi:outer membrane protein assembly factor BamD